VNRKLQFLLFLCGAGVFAFFVAQIGTTALLANAKQTGWMFMPLLFLTALMYLCAAAAAWLMLAREPSRPPFWKLFSITWAGFSINFVTPLLNLGGEPFKIAALSRWLGVRRATSFAVLYQLVHSLGMLLTYLAAILCAFVVLPARSEWRLPLAAAFVVLLGLAMLVFWAHRHGGLQHLLDLLHRVPGLRRLARRVEPQREHLRAMDEQITRFYHEDRGRFWLAVLLEFLGRGILMSEFYLILLSVGVDMGLVRAFTLGSLASLAGNLFFFVPYEIGAKEGSVVVLLSLVGVAPALGIYAALASRVRDLVGIGAGLSLIWTTGAPAAGKVPSTEVA